MAGVTDGVLPEGWVESKFTDILDVQGGTQPPKSEFLSEPKQGYVRLLQIRDFGSKPVPTYVPDTSKLKKCNSSDLLIGRYGASLGRICTGMSGAYNVALAKVIAGEYLVKPFLKAYLGSQLFQQPLALLSRSAQNGFNKKDLESFEFVLPPLAEQKVIAEKLDSLLAQVESTKARLERLPEILKRFRQSVLDAAVSGRLTEEWRDNNISSIWSAVSLGDLIIDGPKNGLYKPAKLYGTGIKIVRIDGFYDGELCDWSSFKRVQLDDKEAESWALNINDILINRVNSIEYLGKCGLVRSLPELTVFESNIMRITLDTNKASPAFIKLFLTSLTGLERLRENAKLAVNQASINQNDVKSCSLDLPPLEEQTEIVRRVEELFAYADTIQQQADAALQRVNSLTQSILAKAFRGELTADWRAANPELISGDNSAEALLEKIKAERAAQKPKKKTRAKKSA